MGNLSNLVRDGFLNSLNDIPTISSLTNDAESLFILKANSFKNVNLLSAGTLKNEIIREIVFDIPGQVLTVEFDNDRLLVIDILTAEE